MRINWNHQSIKVGGGSERRDVVALCTPITVICSVILSCTPLGRATFAPSALHVAYLFLNEPDGKTKFQLKHLNKIKYFMQPYSVFFNLSVLYCTIVINILYMISLFSKHVGILCGYSN